MSSKNTSMHNMVYLRTNNRLTVLRQVALHKDISRVELASSLSFSKMSITDIVSELMENGLVRETGYVSRAEGAAVGRLRNGFKHGATLNMPTASE